MMTLLKEYKGEQGRFQPSEITIVPTYHSKLVDTIIIGISFLFFIFFFIFAATTEKVKKPCVILPNIL